LTFVLQLSPFILQLYDVPLQNRPHECCLSFGQPISIILMEKAPSPSIFLRYYPVVRVLFALHKCYKMIAISSSVM
jgi:hypothetical protein